MRPFRLATCCVVLSTVVCLFATASFGEDPLQRPSADGLLKSAEEIYKGLFAMYQQGRYTGPLDVQALGDWSRKIMMYQTALYSRREPLTAGGRVQETPPAIRGGPDQSYPSPLEATGQHLQRMKELEALALAQFRAGRVLKTTAEIARHHRMTAEHQLGVLKKSHHVETDVILPDAKAEPLVSKPSEVVVNIDAEGSYYVAGKLCTLEELQEILKVAYVNNPGRASVVIRADKRSILEWTVAVMNACKKVGIRDYRLTTSSTGSSVPPTNPEP